MDSLVKWVTENWATVVVLAYMLLNLVNGVLALVPGDQGEGAGGWLSKVRSVLDRVSVLTNRTASGTLKLPLTTSKPAE